MAGPFHDYTGGECRGSGPSETTQMAANLLRPGGVLRVQRMGLQHLNSGGLHGRARQAGKQPDYLPAFLNRFPWKPFSMTFLMQVLVAR